MPVVLDGEPLLDTVPDSKGAFIATATAEWVDRCCPILPILGLLGLLGLLQRYC